MSAGTIGVLRRPASLGARQLIVATISTAENALVGTTVTALGQPPTCAFQISRKSGKSSAPATWTCALRQLAKPDPAAFSTLSIFLMTDSACRRTGSPE